MLGVGFNDTLPLTRADFAVYLAMDFLHQVVFVALMVEKITVAGFARKDGLSVGVKATANFGIYEHGVTVGTERPRICGMTKHV